ncbi:MAG: hypothetical protein HKN12_03165, partial [Gemmatimonadetes bacterium]|nr:hypothetical protein [Gemmatimonadota bacterium]
AEGTRWRIDEEDVGIDAYWQGAAALRGTLPVGPGAGVTGTVRVDGEEGRRRAVQGRTEGWWTQGPLRVFGTASHNEQFPERGAVGDENEVHRSAEAGLVFGRGGFRARVDGFVTRITDRRRDATLEELRAREPVLDAPVGNAQIEGVTAGVTTGLFHFPGCGSSARPPSGRASRSRTRTNSRRTCRFPSVPAGCGPGRAPWSGRCSRTRCSPGSAAA